MIWILIRAMQLTKRASAFTPEFSIYATVYVLDTNLKYPDIIIDIADSFLRENSKITHRSSRTLGVKMTRFYSLCKVFLFRVSLLV